MKTKAFAIILFFCASSVAYSQHTGNDYANFRRQALKEHAQFRKQVYDGYADFLKQVWHEFKAFKGQTRLTAPKPLVAPRAEPLPVEPQPGRLPQPKVPDRKPEPQVRPTSPTLPVPSQDPRIDNQPKFDFAFYNVTMQCHKMATQPVPSLQPEDIAKAWRNYSQATDAACVANSLIQLAQAYGFNDWLTVELVRNYVDALCRQRSATDRIVLQHYLLMQMGYNVRMARTDRQLVLLIPTQQTMYEQPYLTIDNQRYYVFGDRVSPVDERTRSYYSYDLPSHVKTGRIVSLLYSAHNNSSLFGQQLLRTITDGRLTITVHVSKNLMEALRHYPPMDIPFYAQSVVSPALHNEVWQQLRAQLQGMSQRDAVAALLHFGQYAFAYATDGEQHGYEKAYFLEENFYYPKNDCEDRAIFLASAIRQLLNLDVQLVQYPGHECTAVHFTDSSVVGDGYIYDGRTYLICDPCYIGAGIGRCMPDYKQVQPKVQLW